MKQAKSVADFSSSTFSVELAFTLALTPALSPHPPTLRYGAVQIYSRVEA